LILYYGVFMKNTFGIWLKQSRADFLILSVVLVMIGGAASRNDGIFNLPLFIFTLIGVVLAHASVNFLNEYSDWKTGIDSRTKRTPFSGGTGTLQMGYLPPSYVRSAAYISLGISFIIGVFLAWHSSWQVIIYMVIGGIVSLTYTDYLAKWMLGEIASGVTLGSLVVIGTYVVQTGYVNQSIVWASIPPGILTMLLLFLNEFPDVEADKTGGRHHMVIVFGRKASSFIYSALIIMVYVILTMSVFIGGLPKAVLLGLLTLPIAITASLRAIKFADDTNRLVPAMTMNVVTVLATDFLIALGYFIS